MNTLDKSSQMQAELFEEQRRMAERQITMYEVLRAVSESHDLNTVAKLAVEAHGERIWVESTSDQDTTFTFSLTVVPSSA
jgi:signal transduction histidine kinase